MTQNLFLYSQEYFFMSFHVVSWVIVFIFSNNVMMVGTEN